MSTRQGEHGEHLLDEKSNGVIVSPVEDQRGKYWSNQRLNGDTENGYYTTLLENQNNENLTGKPGDLYPKLNLYPEEKPYPEPEPVTRCFDVTLRCLDYSISSFVIAPLVVGCWLSLWMIIDAYPGVFLEINSFLFGSTLIFVQTLVREDMVTVITNISNKACQRFCYAFVSRVYVYVFFFCGILQWRSLWSLLDYYCEKDVKAVSCITIFSLVFVLYFRMPQSLLAPPYHVGREDNPMDVFVFPTWFSLSPKDNNILLYSLDCFFSVFVIGSLLVFVWRGAWTLIDIFLLPNDPLTSAWYSLIIGYIIVFITFAMQPIMKRIVKKLRGFSRLCTVDAYLIFSFSGTIHVWRGIWNLLTLYFLPNSPMMGAWICHLGCFLLLILMNSSNSLLVRGVYVDAEEEGSKCVDFPCYYLRLFFLARRKKQLLRQFQKKQIHNLKRRKSEADGYAGSSENSPPQKTKLEEPSVIV